ncbi:Mth938-like domain-containing protein [Labrenzia sp. 011]|uniref:Mth938-like domain-containing protein n=1 Tax=Labrenzia sp. 011 TaxID=2171494 RepID=UPI000D5253F2|nr:Mth938-like domain-containing protein [Labrenzia sp. 011]PVB63684.1 hypothetical protein DCO57_02585 [Labrenzia sp. 011]
MEIRNAHFPGRAPIDAYGNGGFRFAQMSHLGSLLCVPSGIYGWNLTDPSEFTLEAFSRVFEETDDIEVLLVGTGKELTPLPAALRDKCREFGILADPMSTGAAVRTFNVLLSENRAVATALLAVE